MSLLWINQLLTIYQGVQSLTSETQSKNEKENTKNTKKNTGKTRHTVEGKSEVQIN